MSRRCRHIASYALEHPLCSAAHSIGAVVRRARGRSALGDGLPWMPWDAIAFLDAIATRQARVFEYGSGGSTLFFARRVAQVVSVEHDAAWCERVGARLAAERLANVELLCREPDAADDAAFSSPVRGYEGRSFRRYVETIAAYPDAHFDIVVVDGRARVRCVEAALAKVRAGGVLVLDNADRDRYAPAMAMMARFAARRFRGLTPYQLDPDETVAWTIGDAQPLT